MATATSIPVSPLLLADRLLTLAQDADRAGLAGAATHVMTAMFAVLDGRSRLTGQPQRQARQLRRADQGASRAA